MAKEYIKKGIHIVSIMQSFLILDIYIRLKNAKLGSISFLHLSPNLFTLAWIFLLIAIILLFKKRTVRRIIYLSCIIFFQIMLVTNYIHYQIFNIFFSFKSMSLASEASAYFKVIFDYLDFSLIFVLLISIISTILAFRFMPQKNETSPKLSIAFFSVAIFCYIIAKLNLGTEAPIDAWDNWAYKRNIYNTYSDTTKSLQISGLFEYVIRDFYLSKVSALSKDTKKDINYLNDYFENYEEDYTSTWDGRFKDKNVIIVLMESIDDWLVTKDIMPTVRRLMDEGIEFENHFSPIYGGGATFNAEFMINTGYMTPLNSENASNRYGNNYFPYSLPNLFKNAGYTANYFHQNKKSYYNRIQMTRTFGYENYYSSYELRIPLEERVLDTHLLKNEMLRDKIVPDHDKFMSFIITYSAHTPYNIERTQCNASLTEKERLNIEQGKDENKICIKAQARETDNFFEELLKVLEEKEKLDNTVIIGITDHYAYGYPNREEIYKKKNANDINFLHKVPFFIWSSDINEPMKVKEVNSNLDFVPTVAALFGLEFESKYFVGKNIFSPNYEGLVFFSEYSWYDGEVYYKDGEILEGENVSDDYLSKINRKINNILDINEKILSTNYFQVIKKRLVSN